MQILFSVLCYIFFVSPCFNCPLWWQSKVSCILSLSFYSGCKCPLCSKQCFQNHSTLFPPICYHTECWALQYCAFNSNLICSSLSDVNFALVIPFFLARWLQCKQHYISWLLIPDYTIEIANNVRVIKWNKIHGVTQVALLPGWFFYELHKVIFMRSVQLISLKEKKGWLRPWDYPMKYSGH